MLLAVAGVTGVVTVAGLGIALGASAPEGRPAVPQPASASGSPPADRALAVSRIGDAATRSPDPTGPGAGTRANRPGADPAAPPPTPGQRDGAAHGTGGNTERAGAAHGTGDGAAPGDGAPYATGADQDQRAGAPQGIGGGPETGPERAPGRTPGRATEDAREEASGTGDRPASTPRSGDGRAPDRAAHGDGRPRVASGTGRPRADGRNRTRPRRTTPRVTAKQKRARKNASQRWTKPHIDWPTPVGPHRIPNPCATFDGLRRSYCHQVLQRLMSG